MMVVVKNLPWHEENSMKYRMWDVVQLLWLVIIGVYNSGYIHGMVTMSMHVRFSLSTFDHANACCKVACPFK